MSAQPSNVVRRGEPSRTAYLVATLRAVHQLLDDPLVLPDPVALSLLGRSAEAQLRKDPFAWNDPMARGLRAAVVARSRFVEDELTRCMADGVCQYVVLGAGLDTYAYRRPDLQEPLRVFEVDQAGSQRWKRQLLADAGICPPSFLSFVPFDLECDDLLGALVHAGFRVDQPACVSWMGVTTYLTTYAVHSTLTALAGLAVGSRVCFDHRVPASLLCAVDRAIDDLLAQRAADAGEPWLSTFEPANLQRQLFALGFGSAASFTPEGLNARYFARRRDGLCMGGGLRLVCAGTSDVRGCSLVGEQT